MFGVFVVYVAAVVVANLIISAVVVGRPFPGGWGHESPGSQRSHRGPHEPAFAGRLH